MASYICLLKWTAKGMEEIKGSPGRLDTARELFASMGCEINDTYMTFGEYDLVVVMQAPDDTSLSKALLTLGSTGNVTTTTLRAFREDEYRDIIGSLP